ncbi:phosphate signaling complex protein PhoU [Neobacillus sp. FSL H8-0543]|uniref:phosphate signaling complex protein PhoU n=1 Tax=Neobacillus sp. FSL H8-0543 TaxID=2954672 RepID=UPI0031584664
MSTRSKFDNKLMQLKEKLLVMEGLAEQALKNSVSALINQDIEKANLVINSDSQINSLEHEIHDKALLLITRESPVAKDLRSLNVALKVSSEIERMADLAVNIAKATVHIGADKHFKEIVDIQKMMDTALEMVAMSIKAYISEDILLAQKCAEKDDEVDKMFGNLVHELISLVPENPNATNQIIQLSFVCRFIERIADHSTNISENVIYLVTGKRFELNT